MYVYIGKSVGVGKVRSIMDQIMSQLSEINKLW